MSDLLKLMRSKFAEGNEKQNEERKISSKSTAGTFRGAMGGAITSAGILSSKCPRLDQARILGVEKQCSAEDRVMFSAGFGHELYLESQFKSAGFEFEREQPVDAVVHGKPWKGTPDFQLKIEGEWVGVEAKSLVSNFSVHKQMKFDWPYMRHILQSTHYMAVLERSEWLICIGHYFYAAADGAQYKPSIRWYSVKLVDEKYQVVGEKGQLKELDYGPKDVLAYLKLLKTTNAKETLAPRAIEKEIGMGTYNRCKYCPMESSCNAYDASKIDYDEWLKRLEKKESK